MTTIWNIIVVCYLFKHLMGIRFGWERCGCCGKKMRDCESRFNAYWVIG